MKRYLSSLSATSIILYQTYIFALGTVGTFWNDCAKGDRPSPIPSAAAD